MRTTMQQGKLAYICLGASLLKPCGSKGLENHHHALADAEACAAIALYIL